MTYICVKIVNLKIRNMKKDIKEVVKEKYSLIASQSKGKNESSCCGYTGCCDTIDYAVFAEDYTSEEGYSKDADLGLGCGLPTSYAGIKKGNSVLDLGSGAGNDCFVARAQAGPEGKVTGLDFTEEMISRAIENNKKLGYTNIEFIKGDIEQMPLKDNQFDVVVSNCVLNLVPDKDLAFGEIHRVLVDGGHFCISDVVIEGELPEKIKSDAEMYAGCVSGAISKTEYLQIIKDKGFKNVIVNAEKEIDIPNSIMLNYVTLDELRQYKKDKIGIYSITVNAQK